MIKILIVDDNPGDRKLIELALKETGWDSQVTSVEDANQAMKILKTEIPDLILMDIMMPEMLGGDAVRMLKADQRTRLIPVVFLTGVFGKQDEKEQGKGINVDGQWYSAIAKPIEGSRLKEIIQKHVKAS